MSQHLCRTLVNACQMQMCTCWGASFLSGIRHQEMGKGTRLNQGPFVCGDAEFRVWGIGVGTATGPKCFLLCVLLFDTLTLKVVGFSK